jgi:hypothetical protein
MEQTLDQATAEAVQIVNTTLVFLKPGPEMFIAVDLDSVTVTWRKPGDNDLISRAHQEKLCLVKDAVRHELAGQLHQLPQVLIVDDTGGVISLFAAEFGVCDPALVFPG